MTGGLLPFLQQWLLFVGVTLVVGCVAWWSLVRPRAARELGPARADALRQVERRTATVGTACAAALLGVWLLRMVVQVIGFRDPFVPLSEDVSFLLFETFWGTVWMGQGIVLLLLLPAFALARSTRGGGRPAAWWAASALAPALVATLALSSHAMGVESARSLIVSADGLHALGAGVWVGSLALILSVGRTGGSGRGGAAGGADPVLAAQLRAFSPMAVACVSILVGMGLVLAWTHLTTPSDLWTTGYGRILAAKVALVGGVCLLGFVNWKRDLPRSDTAEGLAAVRRRGAWEVSLAGGVLLLTAILTHSVKP